MASINNNANSNNNIQTNFNPSWMHQTIPTRSTLATNNIQTKLPVQPTASDCEETQTCCDPIFAKHSYGREDLLAMIGKDNMKAPTSLEKCAFFVGKPQIPVVLTSYTETEMRLQQNMNSSKALSAFNRNQGHANSEGMVSNETILGSGTSTQPTGTQPIGPTRKYQPLQQENKQHTSISNRWSALTSSNVGIPQKPAWKNGQPSNVASGVGTGNVDRNTFREKSGFGNQFERINDNTTKKLQRKENKPPENEQISENTDIESTEPANSEHIVKNDQTTTMQPKPIQQLKANEDIQNIIQQCIPPTNTLAEPAIQPSQQQPDKWFYLDPSAVQRGPFDTQQMQAWFSSGYFTASLQVRRTCDSRYITLGDLYRINGEQTPFILRQGKSDSNTLPNNFENTANILSTNPIIGHHLKQQSPSDLLATAKPSATTLGPDVERIWAVTPLEDIAPVPIQSASGSVASSGFVHSAFSQHIKEFELEKMLQAKEIKILEEQRKLREKEELLRRDEQERSEKERRIHEIESELKRKQEELDRIAQEKDTEFEKRCIQMAEYERKRREELAALEQRIISEQQRQQLRMEEEDRRRARELQELLAREQERQRLMVEEEVKRKREEEEMRLRLSLQEAQHMKELAQEQARRAEEEQRRRMIEEQQKHQQRALDTARAERIKQQEIASKAEAAAREEQEKISAKTSKQHKHNVDLTQQSTHPQTSTIQKPHSPLTLTQQSQVQQTRPAWQSVNMQSTQPLQINISSQPPYVENKQQQAIITSAAAERERKGWQQVSLPKPAPIPPSITGKTPIGNVASAVKSRQAGQTNSNVQKVGKAKQINKQQQPQSDDKFTTWIIKRVKELNSSVDAEVFANFIAQIDSPNEAEDYIIGYLGDKKEVKDFHREFLNKRIELRPRVQQTKKDDLSRPAAALNTDAEHLTKIGHSSTSTHSKPTSGGVGSGHGSNGSTGTNIGGINAAKKKKAKKVLDPSTLGFRPVSDSNRVNAGEIDTVPLVLPGTNRKR